VLNLGNTLNRLGRTAEAASALRRAVELDPAHWQAGTNLGNTLMDKGELAEATRLYAELARGGGPVNGFRLAYLQMLGGRPGAAVEAAEAALAAEPTYAPALWVAGAAASGLGQRGIGAPAVFILAAVPCWLRFTSVTPVLITK
jgi:protein O-GlcNAc transferase